MVENALASAGTDLASWALCWACSSAAIASTSESANPETRSQIELIPRDEGAELSTPRYWAVAGRIIVEAISRAQFASMSWTLT